MPTFLHSSPHTHTHTHTHASAVKCWTWVTVGRCSPRLTVSEIQTKGAGPTKTLLLVRQYVAYSKKRFVYSHYSWLFKRPTVPSFNLSYCRAQSAEKNKFSNNFQQMSAPRSHTHTHRYAKGSCTGQGHAQIRQGQLLVDFSCAFTVQTIIHSEILND